MRLTTPGFFALACFIGFIGAAGPAHAAPILDGKTIQTSYLFPNTSTVLCQPVNAVVGSGVELASFCGIADIDFSDTNIKITLTRDANVNNVAFDGFKFFDVLGQIRDDLNATLNPSTNYAGFTASRLAGGDADTLLVNIQGLAGLRGQFISIDVAPRVPDNPTVPEPATMTLLGTGALGMLARRRGRQQPAARR